ncbi:MAG: M20 family peptidase [Candidatus Binataceae bacterium]
MRALKVIGFALVALVSVLAAIVAVRTMRLASRSEHPQAAPKLALDQNVAAERLAGAIRIRTVSTQDPAHTDSAAFAALHDYLKQTFPALHEALRRETVATNALLYTWTGSDASLAPIILMAHQDVVPVAAETESQWSVPAFEGRIADGFIWGRGTIDDKGSLLAIMQATELLVTSGFKPKRTVYLAFGHDEEVISTGAPATAKLLRSRGVKPEFVLDEGGSIVEGVVSGIDAPVAMVGVAEKGYMTIELTAKGAGGHSSMPPDHTAIGILSKAIERLETHQFPARFKGLTEQMLTTLAPAAKMPMRAVFANTWLFGPLISNALLGSPRTAATIRTTTAVTMIDGGVKENVLPSEAHAIVNLRLLPGDSVDTLLEHVRGAIADDHISMRVLTGREPTPVASTDTEGFRAIERSIFEAFPNVAAVAPILTLGGTDSRYYDQLTSKIYRFTPTIMRPDDLGRFHGIDERIPVDGYAQSVGFYVQLVRNVAQ